MPNYDFKTLSPIDFEDLVRDLLQLELNCTLESFKSGRDNGIDLRFSEKKENGLIIQCKHYAESSFSKLKNDLKKELEKVKKLNPKKYIVATSVGLTPGQKDKLVDLLQPYIERPGDIYGKNDLNGLLAKFGDVEKRTFKLWLSSVSALEEIFNKKSKNISRDELQKIHLHSQYYVQNESFMEAIEILEKYNFCIIAGIPGIGKTILAEMLTLHYANIDYEVVRIMSDISEAHEFDYINQRRIFYYDDFLGQTSLSEKLNKNEDQKLLDFISAITNSKISKLILTTREYILNQASLVYEKISRANIVPNMCIVDLSKYTRLNRAKILYNHIYFSDLPEKYKIEILKSKNYLVIIDHANYSPRIIDLMTQLSRVSIVKPNKYLEYFEENLNNPLALWKHAFEEQLSQRSRNLLLVMVTLPEKIFLKELQLAFDAFHFYYAKEYSYSAVPTDFTRALKELEGNFVITEKDNSNNIVVSFHNPSIRDFLREHLYTGQHELKVLIQTAIFFEQILLLWNFKDDQSGLFKYRQHIIDNKNDMVAALKRTMFTDHVV